MARCLRRLFLPPRSELTDEVGDIGSFVIRETLKLAELVFEA